MKFDLLYKRAFIAEENLKKHKEENVEQYDHSASVEEAEEDDRYEDRDDDYGSPFRSKKFEEAFSDVPVNLNTRPKECVAEGKVIYTMTFEKDDVTGEMYRYVDDIVDYEDLQVFLVGDEKSDAVEITDDLTPEEMEIVEDAVYRWLVKHVE